MVLSTRYHHPDFEQIKEKAWQLSQDMLYQWQKRLQNLITKNSTKIEQNIKQLASFYSEKPPNKVLVSLNYYPGEGHQKGEPINYLLEKGRFKEKIADVLYWVSNLTILPTDTSEDIKNLYFESAQNALMRILHEVQHGIFQKNKLHQLINQAEKKPSVKKILNKLQPMSGTYIEISDELITSYIEASTKLTFNQNATTAPDKLPLVIEVNKYKCSQVVEAVIKEDIEGWKNKDNWPGPYTDLRQSWEKALGSLPEGYQTQLGEINVTKKASDKSYMGTSIYEIASKLPPDLLKNYINQEKAIDIDFMIKLYKMVSKRLTINA